MNVEIMLYMLVDGYLGLVLRSETGLERPTCAHHVSTYNSFIIIFDCAVYVEQQHCSSILILQVAIARTADLILMKETS